MVKKCKHGLHFSLIPQTHAYREKNSRDQRRCQCSRRAPAQVSFAQQTWPSCWGAGATIPQSRHLPGEKRRRPSTRRIFILRRFRYDSVSPLILTARCTSKLRFLASHMAHFHTDLHAMSLFKTLLSTLSFCQVLLQVAFSP